MIGFPMIPIAFCARATKLHLAEAIGTPINRESLVVGEYALIILKPPENKVCKVL